MKEFGVFVPLLVARFTSRLLSLSPPRHLHTLHKLKWMRADQASIASLLHELELMAYNKYSYDKYFVE